MSNAYESNATILFHETGQKELGAALEDTTISNGIILTVNSIEVLHPSVIFRGRVNRDLFIARSYGLINEDYEFLKIRTPVIGRYHTTWQSTLSADPHLGLLVFHAPYEILNFRHLNYEQDDESPDYLRVDLVLPKKGSTLPNGVIGSKLCDQCGRIIQEQRVKALPKTRLCVQCQSAIEQRRKS